MTYSIGMFFFFSAASYNFNDGSGERCITPSKKGGICLALHNCSTLYNAFERRKVDDQETKKYMYNVICGNERPNRKVLFVCCERDASPCITPEDRIGSCVPLER